MVTLVNKLGAGLNKVKLIFTAAICLPNQPLECRTVSLDAASDLQESRDEAERWWWYRRQGASTAGNYFSRSHACLFATAVFVCVSHFVWPKLTAPNVLGLDWGRVDVRLPDKKKRRLSGSRVRPETWKSNHRPKGKTCSNQDTMVAAWCDMCSKTGLCEILPVKIFSFSPGCEMSRTPQSSIILAHQPRHVTVGWNLFI